MATLSQVVDIAVTMIKLTMLTSMVNDALDASWKSNASETFIFVIYRMLPVAIMLFHLCYGLSAVHKLEV